MKAIVLAAGYGKRLYPLTVTTPKALLEMGSGPMISYPINALLTAGITDITVVVGYKSDDLVVFLKKLYPAISFCLNDQYDGDNAISIYAVRSYVKDDPFILVMGDHMISPQIVETLLSNSNNQRSLCVDSAPTNPSQVNDGTKVIVDSKGQIIDIGKSLENWNFIDTGVFLMDREVIDTIKYLKIQQGTKVSISEVVKYMADIGKPFKICDVTGEFWADVDTVEDYYSVRKLLKLRTGISNSRE